MLRVSNGRELIELDEVHVAGFKTGVMFGSDGKPLSYWFRPISSVDWTEIGKQAYDDMADLQRQLMSQIQHVVKYATTK